MCRRIQTHFDDSDKGLIQILQISVIPVLCAGASDTPYTEQLIHSKRINN